MVKMHFLSCGYCFLLFILFFNKWISPPPQFFFFFFGGGGGRGGGGETLFPLAERDFLSSENCFLLLCTFFLQIKTVTKTSWNKWSVLSIKWTSLISKSKQCQFGRVLKIPVRELICFTFSELFRYNFTPKRYKGLFTFKTTSKEQNQFKSLTWYVYS